MTSKTITDRAGDTLRLSTGSLTAGPGEITIKVTERFRGREAVAAAHVDPVVLRAALDEVAPAEQSRGFTAEDVDDAMVDRAAYAYRDDESDDLGLAMRAALSAALTPPPARDPRAVALEADISRDGEDAPFDLTPEHASALADHLAALGWTKEER